MKRLFGAESHFRHPYIRFALAGAVASLIALPLAGHETYSVGPGQVEIQVSPDWTGSTVIAVPPLGTVRAETHSAPIRVTVSPAALNVAGVETLFETRPSTNELLESLRDDGNRAGIAFAIRTAVLGGLAGLIAFLIFRGSKPLEAVASGVAGMILPLSLLIATVSQFDARTFREPTLTGALTRAPDVVGPIEEVADRFQAYRRQLDAIGKTTFRIYRFLEEQSVVPENAVRVLHISDLHLNPVGYDVSLQVARQFNADVIVDTGDLTAQGTEVEAGFASRIDQFKVPYLFVRGNHDSDATVAAVAREPNAQVLDGRLTEVGGLTFYGISDPLFTPGSSEALGNREQQQAKIEYGREVTEAVKQIDPPPDVVLIHDRAAVGGLVGSVPLILSGHGHRWFSRIRDSTVVLGVGSTGAAGLESLTPQPNTPLVLQVLYFDVKTRKLLAYDRIEVRGPQQEFRLSRTVLEQNTEEVEAQDTSRT